MRGSRALLTVPAHGFEGSVHLRLYDCCLRPPLHRHKVWQPEGHLGKLGNFPCYDPTKVGGLGTSTVFVLGTLA